jgi:ribosomal protein S19
VVIIADRNATHKEAKHKLKYNNNLCTKIKRVWNMKCAIIPAVIGATAVATNGLTFWHQNLAFKV